MPHQTYELGEFSLNIQRRELRRGEQKIHLSNKPYQVLLYLVEHRERMVSRDELLKQFWQGKEVYDETLTKCVGSIRKALDERPGTPRFIETSYGEGYRFIGPCTEQVFTAESLPAALESAKELPETTTETATSELPTAVSPPPEPPPYALRKPRSFTFIKTIVLLLLIFFVTSFVWRNQRVAIEQNLAVPRPDARSVAVLPLKNLTGDPANEYLSDGLTDSLVNSLARVSDLKVIARGSVFEFKNKEVSAQEVGRRLGVAAMVEGSLLKSGDHLRVAVRLVDTRDSQVLWVSQADDNAVTNTFAVEEEIAQQIISNLRIKLNAEAEQYLAKHNTKNVRAYQAYLKGRYFLNQRTAEGISRSIEYFQQAIAIDPQYALAYAALAESYDKSYWFMGLPPKEAIPKEREAAEKALALDETLCEAHVAMATVYANEWKLPEAAREEERAIELNPGNAEAHHNYAYRLIDLGRPEKALAEIRRARELDPLNVVMNIDVGEILLFARHYDEAINALQEALEMDPKRANAHWMMAKAYEKKGMNDEAVAQHLQEFTLKGESAESLEALSQAYQSGGMMGFLRERLNLELKRSYVEPTTVAELYTMMGDKDQAFAWLEIAYENRSPTLVGLRSSPIADPLRGDSRYTDLLRRVGLAE